MGTIHTVESNPAAFLEALQTSSVVCTTKGHWYSENCLMRIIRWLICWFEDNRLERVVRVFSYFAEKNGVQFTKEGALSPESQKRYELYQKMGKEIESQLQNRCFKTSVAHEALRTLRMSMLSMEYRFEKIKPQQVVDETVYKELHSMAIAWKNAQLLRNEDKALTDGDVARLKEAACYTAFTSEFLLKDNAVRNTFFKWTIRNRLPSSVFVEFVNTQKRIHDALLASRIGFYGGHLLNITGKSAEERAKSNQLHKDLTLPFEQPNGQYQAASITDKTNTVTLSYNYKLTVAKVFNICKHKNDLWGKIEMSAKGMSNWHSGRMARWNAERGHYERIDVTHPNWWKQLPPMKQISLKEAQAMFGAKADGINWLGRNMATRSDEKLVMQGTHAYNLVYIPERNESGEVVYSIHPFTKSTEDFPSEWLDTKIPILRQLHRAIEYGRYIAKTSRARIVLDLSSCFAMHRQHGGTLFTMTPAEGNKVMDMIAQDMIGGWQGLLGYNIFYSNCAGWSASWRKVLGDEKVPQNLFRTHFENSEPEHVVGAMFTLVKKTPRPFSRAFFYFLFTMMGGNVGHTVRVPTADGKSFELKKVTILDPECSPWNEGVPYYIPASERRLFLNPGLLPAG